MKKWTALALALMMLIPAAALGEQFKGEIVIGIYEPASGSNGAGGKQETLGIYYANAVAPTVELSDGVYNIRLVEVDNQSSTDKAPSAAQQLVSEGASIVLGSYGSGVSMAAAPIFNAAGVVAIALSATNPQVTIGNPLYYRICYLDPFQGTVLANFAWDEFSARKAYTLAELGNPYDVGLAFYFTEHFKKLGGDVTGETFPQGTSDFTAYLTSAVNAGAEVIFAPTSTDFASQIITQAAANGIKIPILAGDTWDSGVISNAAKGTDLSVSVSTFFDEGDTSPAAVEFVQGFKAWLNANPDKLENNGGTDAIAAVSSLGYDGYMVALEALKLADSAEREDIAEVMADVNYTGVTGNIVFGENGDAVRDQAVIKKTNNADGTFAFVKVQSVAK
ncbi:MAG TPA: ABC transporter substrate-binding protein [Candidatus Limnocylindria bacterium]|nr:ABC transporter substrate-binding protein [Candidatus Limnocylindria bacterium]